MGIPLDIYLDAAGSGRVMAHLLEPPGLGVRFESRGEMQGRLPGEIRRHLTWLVAHGELTAVESGGAFRIAEELPILGNFESGDDVGLYGPDTEPVRETEVEHYLRIGGWAHEDLLALVVGLDEAALDWTRDGRTRPIRRVLRHVVGVELWYMGRIIEDPDHVPLPAVIADADRQCDATEDQVERLHIIWPAFQAWARSLTPELRRRITAPTWWTHYQGERWTARKMLRRCIEHCREHTRNIEGILADYAVRGGRSADGS